MLWSMEYVNQTCKLQLIKMQNKSINVHKTCQSMVMARIASFHLTRDVSLEKNRQLPSEELAEYVIGLQRDHPNFSSRNFP